MEDRVDGAVNRRTKTVATWTAAMAVPWQRYVLIGTVVLVLVLVFQQVTRGEPDPGIAIVVAFGYLVASEIVRRRRTQAS